MSEWKETEFGKLPFDWDYQPLENYFELITYGFTNPMPTTDEGPYMLTAKDIFDGRIQYDFARRTSQIAFETLLTNKSKPKVNDVLITKDGSIGRVAIVEREDICISQSVALIRPNSKIKPLFLKYLLESPQYQKLIQRDAGGSTIEHVYITRINKMLVGIPEIAIQNSILNVVHNIQLKIDLLKRQNKTLEQIVETLFREKLLENNQKWEMKSFGEFINTTLGGDWGKENIDDDFTLQVCCIRGTDIADLQIGLANRTPIRFVKEKKFESIKPSDGDLILEISGGTDDQSTGRTIYINELNRILFPHPLVFSNFCRLIRPKKKEYSYFIYLYIQYLYNQNEFFNLENGTSGIKNLDYKYLLFELNFLLPRNEKELIAFNKEVEEYFEKINKNKHQIQTLTKLRDTLLPKLMSGEVRVKN